MAEEPFSIIGQVSGPLGWSEYEGDGTYDPECQFGRQNKTQCPTDIPDPHRSR